MQEQVDDTGTASIPVLSLSKAPGERAAWGKSRAIVFLWSAVEQVFVYNPWQISSSVRVAFLRAFGARVGDGVIIRPRTRIKFPWNLIIGDDSWIGEGVWIHNQDKLTIGSNAVISQDTFITNGSHAHRRDMALITREITIEDGAWVTARCVITGGSKVGKSSIVTPMTVVNGEVPPNVIFGAQRPGVLGPRFTKKDM